MNEQARIPGILDRNTIETLQGICREVNPNFLNELIGMFVSLAPELIEKIRAAASSDDSEQVEATAHRLKGSSLNLGGARMGEVCDRLEKKGREEKLEGAKELVERLDECYLELLSELEKLKTPEQG